MRQTSRDHAAYLRVIRSALRQSVAPEVVSPAARDALNIVDRLLLQYIVDEEHADSLSASFGEQFVIARGGDRPASAVTCADFAQVRQVRPGEVPSARLLEMARIDRKFVEAVDQLRVKASDFAITPDAPSSSITTDQLAAYLRSRNDIEAPSIVVVALQRLPGGRSKETLLARLENPGSLPSEIVIRKDRAVELIPGRRSADEFPVIKVAYDFGGIPCPRPLLAESDPSRLGGTFVVTEYVNGVRGGEYFPDIESPASHREELSRSFARALARVHALPVASMNGMAIDRTMAVVNEDHVREMVRAVTDRMYGEPDGVTPSALAACEWLLAHTDYPLADAQPGFVQGDVGLHNSIVMDGEIKALLDWELAKVAPASLELSTIYDLVSALDTWDHFVAEYLASGGRPAACDPRAVLYYRLYKAIWGLALALDMLGMFRSGARRDIVAAGSGVDSRFRHSRNVARAFEDALALG